MNYNTLKLPISVQICTLNEEKNIRACLKSVIKNNPLEILIIDGGSTDRTLEIVKKMKVRLICAGRVGLAKQRQVGITSTTLPFIAIVDADDRLETDCLIKLLKEMIDNKFSAIQANVQPYANETYWQKAWGFFCSINTNVKGKTNMVGRPALFEKESIIKVGFDPFFTFGSEDTDISYRFEQLGYKQGIGTGISYRIHPKTFSECKKKWFSYGCGYARFAYKHPERKKHIIFHLLWNIPFRRMWRAILNGHFIYSPFYLLYGFFCMIGFMDESIKLLKSIRKANFVR